MGTLKHMSLSPDDPPTLDEFLKDRGKAFQQKAVDLLREHSRDHFFAGTVMIHPFRYDHQDGSCCEDPDCQLPHFWTYSPHIHYLGYGFLESSDIFHEKTGWIYVNIKPGKRRSLFATFIYELGHVGVFMCQKVEEFEGCEIGLKWTVIGNVYRYVGLFSRECGGKEHLDSKMVAAMCHRCGEHLLEHEVDIKDTADPEIKVLEVNDNHIIGEHMVWEVTERWHLNIKHYSWVSRFGKKGQTLKPKRKRLPDTRLELDDTFITDSDEEFLIEDDGRP